jgi:hypothetical protein
MNVIFLDIDGVVTSARANGFSDLDPFTVNFISWCAEQGGWKIVISSTWRNGFHKEFWDTIFPGLIHDDWRTKNLDGIRGEEVLEWLSRNDWDNYIILDDDHDFFEHQKFRTIFTDSLNGMLVQHFEELMRLTGVDKWPHRHVRLHDNMWHPIETKWENMERNV